MLNNKLKLVVVGVVVILMVSIGALGFKLISELSNVNSQKKGLELEINLIQEENDNINEENSKIIEEKNAILKEKEELEKKHNEINELYQKELQAVSYQSSNLLSSSYATINKLARGTRGTGLEGLEGAYLRAEETYGVNAIFLMALTAEESAWGNSHRARTQNNMSGFAVYSTGATGAYFNTKEESIMRTARLLKEDYLTYGGQYHYGYSSDSVNVRYCPDDGFNWSNNINKIANELVSKINSR